MVAEVGYIRLRRGAREAALLGNRSKCQRRHTGALTTAGAGIRSRWSGIAARTVNSQQFNQSYFRSDRYIPFRIAIENCGFDTRWMVARASPEA
jgi:hypothetical protein